MAFTYDEVLKLKKYMDEKLSVYVHFHDACGGQYFNLDEPNEDAKHELERYFAKLNKSVKFADDKFSACLKGIPSYSRLRFSGYNYHNQLPWSY